MSEGFNLLFGNAIGSLLGRPVHYVMDSTDVAALVVLLPAWKMWDAPHNTPPHRLAWIALAIGSLASLATSPALPRIEQVEDFIYHNDILYAADSDQTPQFIAVTEDLGKNWESLYEYEDQDLIDEIKPLVKPQEFPVMACDPNNVKICYRVERGDHVEISTDAGSNWETAWQIPEERSYFVERKRDSSVSLKAYDLIILQQNNQSALLVALGSEGILRRELPNGEWQRIAVGWAHPTPFQEDNFSDAFSFVKGEHVFWLTLALFYLVATIAWHQVRRNKPSFNRDVANRLILIYPAIYFVCALVFYNMYAFLGTSITGRERYDPLFYFFLYLPFFAEAIAIVHTDRKSVIVGCLLPGVIYLLGFAGNIINVITI